jgi:hypothetical protein
MMIRSSDESCHPPAITMLGHHAGAGNSVLLPLWHFVGGPPADAAAAP